MNQSLQHTPSSGLRVFNASLLSFLLIMMPFVQLAAAQKRQMSGAGRQLSEKKRANAGAENLFVNPSAVAGPITATKTDSYPSSPGSAVPGETITYTVDVTNTGAVDASGVGFSDTIDANTTLVGGSLKVSALAINDTYGAEKNVPLIVAAPGVLSNDSGLPAPTAVPIASGPTSQGGTVTLNADGSFTYTPPNATFTGTDTFTYTATNSQPAPNPGVDDVATVTINVDEAPTVTATTPADNAVNQTTDTNITITFSEPVNVTGTWFTISCSVSGAHTAAVTGGPTTYTLNPNVDFTEGETCTVTVVAAQVTDVDTNDPPDNMAADYVFDFTMDAAPSVQSTTPVNGATGVPTNSNITLTFTESVNLGATPVTISCATSGAHTSTVSASPNTTFTVNPNVDFAQNELCTVTVLAAQVSDTDTNDPPNNMLADFVFSFTTDAAPAVTTTTPTNGATNVATNTTITVNFTESVNATTNSFKIECPAPGNLQTFTLSASPSNTFTLTPGALLPAGVTCTVTVIATQITDQDGNDPPDNMTADHVFSFTTDAAPTVTATTPTNGATQVANNTDVTVTFSENVDVVGNWFSIVCGTSGTHDTTNSTVSGGPGTYTINPTDFANGESCTATILAAQIEDQDTNDPPQNMAANHVFSFTIDAVPTVTTTTPTNASLSNSKSTNITINFSENVGVTAGGVTINCGAGNLAFSGLPQTNVNSIVLDPTADLPPGSTCTVTVLSANTTDSDTGDPPNNLDGDNNGTEGGDHVFTFGVAPDAVNDVDNATGNIGLVIPANGVLANDIGPGAVVDRVGPTTANNVVPNGGSFTSATSGGGSVTMNSDGGFTYVPLAGQASGTDTFKYRISNAGGSSADATVTITITGIVWFICDACGGANQGTLQNPYTSINSFSTNNTGAANKPSAGQRIYIRSGTYDASNDNLTLLANQIVSGQGQAATSFFTPEAPAPAAYAALTAGTRPIIAPTAGNAVALNSGNNLSHFNIGSNISGTCAGGSSPTTGTLLTGASVGNLTIGNMIVNGCGRAINFTAGGTLAVTFDSVTSHDGSTGGILIGSSGGTVNFGNVSVTSSGGTGVSLTSNTAVLTFGDLDITADSGQRGLHATSNTGAITVATGSTATTTNHTAVEIVGVSNASRTPLNIQFTSVTTTGGNTAPNGIVLTNTSATGSPGGFRVLGNGGSCTNATPTCTGGRIQQTQTGSEDGTPSDNVGIGVRLNNADTVVLTRMRLDNHPNFALYGNNVNGFTLDTSLLNGTNGTNEGFDEAAVRFDNLLGTNAITASDISGGRENNFHVVNTSGTLTALNITGSTFRDNHASFGADGINLDIQGTAIATATITGNTFAANRQEHFRASARGTATFNVHFGSLTVGQGNTMTGGHPGGLSQSTTFSTESSARLNFNILGNSINGAILSAITIFQANTTTAGIRANGTISGNAIGTTGVALSGSTQADGITVTSTGLGTTNIIVSNNTIKQYNGDGIEFGAGDTSAVVNATVTGNSTKEPGGFVLHGLHINMGTTAAGSVNACMDIGGAGALENDFIGGSVPANGGFEIRARQRNSSTVRLPGHGGGDPTVYFQNRNTGTPVVSPSGTFGGGAACTQPTAFLTLAPTPNDLPLTVSSPLTSEELDTMVTAAMERWTHSGLNSKQIAAMRELRFEVGDLTGSYLGEASGNRIVVDRDAQGKGWFVDATPADDVEFSDRISATRSYTNPFTSAAGRIDLLTAIEHEIGHKLGLLDSYAEADRNSIMYGYLTVGERRVPAKGQAVNAQAGRLMATHFLSLKDGQKAEGRKQKAASRRNHAATTRALAPVSGETVNHTIGALPAGKAVRITFQVTIDLAFTGAQVSNQGSVTHNLAGSPVVTDDPATGTADDATVTPVLGPPVANDDSYSSFKNQTLNVPAPGVLANDTGGPLTITGISGCVDVTAPFSCATSQGGTVVLESDGSFVYTPPNATFVSPPDDTFIYEIGAETATVTITVLDTSAIFINEVLFNPDATGTNEYIELRGPASSVIPAGTYFVVVDGDAGTTAGDVTTIINLSGLSFGTNGYLVLLQNGNTYTTAAGATVVASTTTGFGGLPGGIWQADSAATSLEDSGATFMLIQTSTAPTLTDDIDANDDGTPDGTVYAGWSVRDSVGHVTGGNGNDRGYGAINYITNASGTGLGTVVTPGFIVVYVGRICDSTGSAAADWVASGTLGGAAPNWTLGSNTSPANFAGKPLNHIGSTNFLNVGPVNNVPGAQVMAEDTTLTFNAGNSNLISISDPDAGGADMKVTLTATNGTFSLSGTTGLSFTTGDGTADPQMVFTGSITNINNALNGLVFTPTANFSSPPDATLAILTEDQGNTGCGGNLTDSDTINITVNADLEVSVHDASVAEPASGTTNMVFTVTLSAPAPGAVAVNFTTADETPGPGKAVAGSCPGGDYTTTSGTVNFTSGQQVQSISVPVCSDGASEPDETFLLNLSGPTGADIGDGTAIGTITSANPAGSFLISELRTSGPGGLGDDFVEVYNNSNTPLTVAASDASAGYGLFKMGADCNATPVLIGTIPNGTVIPARGHYLFVGSQYSLTNYGGTGAAAGNLTLSADIESDGNVAIFNTSNVANLSTGTRLDAVGFGTNVLGNCALLREGSNLGPASGSTLEHSYFRKLCDFAGGCTTPGIPKDTNNNLSDFLFADTTGTQIVGTGHLLGAPGPENLASPIKRDSTILVNLLDTTIPQGNPPNRVRDLTADVPNASTFGTLSARRRIVNNTGAPVTRLRFRIVEMTTLPSPPGVADMRARSSTSVVVSGINDPVTCSPNPTPCMVTVQGTTLEQPPTQAPNVGGGMNSTLSAGTVTLMTPLANGASVNVQFLLGVQQTGTFRFLIIVEALP